MAETILTDDTIYETHEACRQECLAELVNLTDLIVEVATNPECVPRLDVLQPAEQKREKVTA